MKKAKKTKITCKICQTIFFVLPCRLRQGSVKYCGMTCRVSDMTGENNPFFGKSHSKEVIEKLRAISTGRTLSIESRKKVSENNAKYWKGRKITTAMRQAISKAQRGRDGSLSPMWRGGITPLNRRIRHLIPYIEWRIKVFKRDDYTCQNCKVRGGKLHVDHIKPFALILYQNNISNIQQAIDCNALWNIRNGRTLCIECHRKTDTYKQHLKDMI